MRKAMLGALAAAVLAMGGEPAKAGSRYEVYGVEGEDMLKMRAGPGTGYVVLLGLPNGTAVRIIDCQQTGGTRWCEVSLEMARSLRGYVSMAYIRAM